MVHVQISIFMYLREEFALVKLIIIHERKHVTKHHLNLLIPNLRGKYIFNQFVWD